MAGIQGEVGEARRRGNARSDPADGEIAFGALRGFLVVRYGSRDGSVCAEFSWEGQDENDPACLWARMGPDVNRRGVPTPIGVVNPLIQLSATGSNLGASNTGSNLNAD